jgi:hypothetical protein
MRRRTLKRHRGDTAPIKFQITYRDDPMDITGYTFVFSVNQLEEPEDADSPEFFLLGTITDGPNGYVEFAPREEQVDLAGIYWYDVEMTDPGGVISTPVKGRVVFKADITISQSFEIDFTGETPDVQYDAQDPTNPLIQSWSSGASGATEWWFRTLGGRVGLNLEGGTSLMTYLALGGSAPWFWFEGGWDILSLAYIQNATFGPSFEMLRPHTIADVAISHPGGGGLWDEGLYIEAIEEYLYPIDWNAYKELTLALSPGWYWLRFQCDVDADEYRVRYWADGSDEPSSWHLTYGQSDGLGVGADRSDLVLFCNGMGSSPSYCCIAKVIGTQL